MVGHALDLLAGRRSMRGELGGIAFMPIAGRLGLNEGTGDRAGLNE